MVEGGGLENRCTREGTVGSNPTSSAISLDRPSHLGNRRFPLPLDDVGFFLAGPGRHRYSYC